MVNYGYTSELTLDYERIVKEKSFICIYPPSVLASARGGHSSHASQNVLVSGSSCLLFIGHCRGRGWGEGPSHLVVRGQGGCTGWPCAELSVWGKDGSARGLRPPLQLEKASEEDDWYCILCYVREQVWMFRAKWDRARDCGILYHFLFSLFFFDFWKCLPRVSREDFMNPVKATNLRMRPSKTSAVLAVWASYLIPCLWHNISQDGHEKRRSI